MGFFNPLTPFDNFSLIHHERMTSHLFPFDKARTELATKKEMKQDFQIIATKKRATHI